MTMERKKSYLLLIIGLVLLVSGIVLAVYAYNNSYQESLKVNKELKTVEAMLKALEDSSSSGSLMELQAQKKALSAQKLSLERPYSYGLILLFTAIIFTLKGLYNALIGTKPAERADVKRLAQAGLLSALCYIGFAFFKIPMGPGMAAFHFGNVFCVLAALLLGGYLGGLAGAVGMTVADLTSGYVTSAPKTFVLKMCIGLIVGLIAHRIFKLSRSHTKKFVTGVTIFASICGMGFNVVADPVAGYFYKMYLLGIPQDLASALAKVSAVTTLVNAVIAVIAATAFYLVLRPALKKAGLFVQMEEEQPLV